MRQEETGTPEESAMAAMDADRFDTLFEIASRGSTGAEDAVALDEADKEQIREIQAVLRVVDAQRPVTAADLEDIEARFLRLLGDEEPDHPWVSDYQETDDVEVKTLGDMVRVESLDWPATIPRHVLDTLSGSTTPISDLTDTARRPGVLGPLFKEAGLPVAQIPEMFMLMNARVNSLLPGHNGGFVARRQKKKPNTAR